MTPALSIHYFASDLLVNIFDKVVATQLMKYLESTNLISNTHHGFQAKISTETALPKVTDTVETLITIQ